MTLVPKLLFADSKGRVMEHPYLLATLRSGEELVPPQDKPIPLPSAGRLVHLPGRLPVGLDPETGELELVREMKVNGKTFVPSAVGALLPPGYTRTFLPGEVKAEGPVLPQWAYTAAAWGEDGPVAWAMHTDRRSHWDPEKYSTPELKKMVDAHLARFPGNRVLKQLTTCALLYRCFTSQNIFYVRDEGAIPASVMCNARCVGCISDQPKDGPPASHERMDDGPSGEEMGVIGLYHLENATGRTMVSFGQGCEGEPLTRWKFIAEAIRYMRAHTSRGSININTNASLTHGLEALFDAGLDAVRVSLNSADEGPLRGLLQAGEVRLGGRGGLHRAGAQARRVPRAQPAPLPGRHRSRGRGGGPGAAGAAVPGGSGADALAVHRSAPVPGGGARPGRGRRARGHPRAAAPTQGGPARAHHRQLRAGPRGAGERRRASQVEEPSFHPAHQMPMLVRARCPLSSHGGLGLHPSSQWRVAGGGLAEALTDVTEPFRRPTGVSEAPSSSEKAGPGPVF